jgi:hypothetical protein
MLGRGLLEVDERMLKCRKCGALLIFMVNAYYCWKRSTFTGRDWLKHDMARIVKGKVVYY